MVDALPSLCGCGGAPLLFFVSNESERLIASRGVCGDLPGLCFLEVLREPSLDEEAANVPAAGLLADGDGGLLEAPRRLRGVLLRGVLSRGVLPPFKGFRGPVDTLAVSPSIGRGVQKLFTHTAVAVSSSAL